MYPYLYCASDINAPFVPLWMQQTGKVGTAAISPLTSSQLTEPPIIYHLMCNWWFSSTFWVCKVCVLFSVIELVQINNSNTWRKKRETFWTRHNLICSALRGSKLSNPWKLRSRDPCRVTGACSTSSASASSQIIRSTMVRLWAVFHYSASVSTAFQTGLIWICQGITCCWMGPLWSKCQTGEVLKKKCPHLLSWHFPQRLIPSLIQSSLLARWFVSLTGPVLLLLRLSPACPCLRACVCICFPLCAWFELEINNPIDITAMFT